MDIKNILKNKPVIGIVLLLAILLIGSVYFSSTKCEVEGCSNQAKYGDYCATHVCLQGACTNPRAYGSSYCYTHKSSGTAAYYNAENDLEIDVDMDWNSSYTIAEGTMRNNGFDTYEFVKVKGAFITNTGEVVDTDWTYAVGEEGLEPGETTSFRMSVDKDYDITDCRVTIIDFDIK